MLNYQSHTLRIFPYILHRIGGLSVQLLSDFSLNGLPCFVESLQTDQAYRESREATLRQLEQLIPRVQDSSLRRDALKLKRAMRNYKRGKRKEWKPENLNDEQLWKEIEKQLTNYHRQYDLLQAKVQELENAWSPFLAKGSKHLQAIVEEDSLQQGLALSSLSLYDRIAAYRKKEWKTFRKKEFQTERSLWQYLSRICTKTSPFSTFTPLAMTYQGEAVQPLHTSIVKVNAHLFGFFRDQLSQYAPFNQQLQIKKNETLQLRGEEWLCLLNSRNVESIQRLEKTPLLDFIFECIPANKTITFRELVKLLLENVEAEKEQLEAYIQQLIAYGFLCWEWEITTQDANWAKQLQQRLESFQDPLLLQLRETLHDLETKRLRFALSDGKARVELLRLTFNRLKTVAEELLQATQLDAKTQELDLAQLQHFLADHFPFSPERIFYEDTAQVFSSQWTAANLKPIIAELNDLLEILLKRISNPLQQKIQQCYQTHFKAAKRVNILSFYEAFYQYNWEEKPLDTSAKLSDVIAKGEWLTDTHWHLDLNKIASIEKEPSNRLHPFRGSLLQINRSGKAYTDTSFAGYGKMMGRFLDLFPTEVTEALRTWNAQLQGEALWLENTDASLYNPNQHPWLLAQQVKMPFSTSFAPKQIALHEIEVCQDDTSSEIILRHSLTQERINIFDFGFEALASRSPLYQLLAGFGFEMPSQGLLVDAINAHLREEKESEIQAQCRITVGEHLVLQRRAWWIPARLFPAQGGMENAANYLLRLHRWCKDLSMETSLFYTLQPDQKDKSKSDHYKPQYLDLTNSWLVDRFTRAVSKTQGVIKIEEVFPALEGEVVEEILVQWTDKK